MARKAKQACLTLYPEIQQIVPLLTDPQLGALFRALVTYRYTGEKTEFQDKVLKVLFISMANQVDRMEEVKQRNTENIKRRWEKESPDALPQEDLPLDPF